MKVRRLLWGIVFVVIGLAMIGGAFGLNMPTIWAWWPLFIILLGVDMTAKAAANLRHREDQTKKDRVSFASAFTVLFIGAALLGNSLRGWGIISVIGASLVGLGLGMMVDSVVASD